MNRNIAFFSTRYCTNSSFALPVIVHFRLGLKLNFNHFKVSVMVFENYINVNDEWWNLSKFLLVTILMTYFQIIVGYKHFIFKVTNITLSETRQQYNCCRLKALLQKHIDYPSLDLWTICFEVTEWNISDYSNLTRYQKISPPAMKSFWFEFLCQWLRHLIFNSFTIAKQNLSKFIIN